MLTLRSPRLIEIVLHDPAKQWLFLIEAVTSHGPVSPKRHREIESFLGKCQAERIYVTAFLTISSQAPEAPYKSLPFAASLIEPLRAATRLW